MRAFVLRDRWPQDQEFGIIIAESAREAARLACGKNVGCDREIWVSYLIEVSVEKVRKLNGPLWEILHRSLYTEGPKGKEYFALELRELPILK